MSTHKTVDTKIVEMKFDNRDFEKNAQETLRMLDQLKEKIEFSSSVKEIKGLDRAVNGINFKGMASGIDNISSKFNAMGVVGFTVIQRLTNAAMNIGQTMLRSINQPINQMIEGGKSRAMKIANAKFQLEGLKVAWDDIKEDLDYGVKDTAYGLDSAAVVASQLVASQVSLGDEMKAALRGVSGVAAMTNSTYDDIGRIFTQVAGQGRLMGMQLTELSMRGLNVAATLGDAMGKSEEEIRNMVTKGQIDFKTFATVMDETFGPHAKEGNKTFTGALANMNAALSRIGEKVATPTMEKMTDVFNALRELYNGLGKAITPSIDNVNRVVGGALTLVTSLIKKITPLINPIVDKINIVTTALANFLAPIIEKIQNRIEPIKKEIDNVAGAVDAATEPVKEATEQVTKLRDVVRDVIRGKYKNQPEREGLLAQAGFDYNEIQPYVNQVMWGSGTIEEELDKLGDATVGTSTTVEQATEKTQEQVTETAETVDDAIRQLNRDSLSYLVEGIQNIVEIVKQVASSVAKAFKDVFGWVNKLDFVKAVNSVARSFKNFTQALVPAEKGMEQIQGIARGVFSVFDFLARKVREFIAAIQPFRKAVVNLVLAFRNLLGAIGDVIFKVNAVDRESSAFYDVVNLLAEGLGFLVNCLAKVINAFAEWIRSSETAKAIFKTLADVFRAVNAAIKDFVSHIKEAVSGSEEAEGVGQKILKAFKAIGDWIDQSGLKDFIVDGIKTVITTVVDKISELIDKAKESQVISDIVDNITDKFSNLAGILSEFKFPKFDEFMGFIKNNSITNGLNKIEDEANNFDKVMTGVGKFFAGSDTKAGGFTAISAGVLGAAQGNGQGLKDIQSDWERFNKNVIDPMNQTLSKEVPGVVQKTTSMYVNAIPKIVGGIGDVISGIGSAFAKLDLKDKLGTIAQVAAILGSIKIVKGIENVSKAAKKVGESVGNLINSFAKVEKAKARNLNAQAFKTMASSIKEISVSLLIMAGAMALLALIPEDKIGQAEKVMRRLIGAIAVLMILHKILNKTPVSPATKENPVKNIIDQIMNGFKSMFKQVGQGIKMMGAAMLIMSIVAALAIMVKVIKEYDSLDLKDAQSTVMKIGGVLLALTFVMRMIGKATVNSSMMGAALSMFAIIIVLKKMIEVLKEYDALDLEHTKGTLQKMGIVMLLMAASIAIMGKFSTHTGKGSGTNLVGAALAMVAMAIALKQMAKVIEEFGTMETSVLKKGIASLAIVVAILTIAISIMAHFFAKGVASSSVSEKSAKSWKSSGVGVIGMVLAIVAMVAAIKLLIPAIKSLGSMDTTQLEKGLIGLGVIAAGLTATVWALSKVGDYRVLLTFAVMLVALTYSLQQLAMIPFVRLVSAAASLAGVFAALAIVAHNAHGFTKTDIAAITLIMAFVGVVGGVLYLLSQYTNMKQLQATALSLSGVLVVISACMKSVMKGSKDVNAKQVLKIVGIMILFLGSVAACIGLLSRFGGGAKSILASALAIDAVIVVLIAMFNRLSIPTTSKANNALKIAGALAMIVLAIGGSLAIVAHYGTDYQTILASALAIDAVVVALIGMYDTLNIPTSSKANGALKTALALGAIVLAVSVALRILTSLNADWKTMIAAAGAIDIVLVVLTAAFNHLEFKQNKLSTVAKNVLAIAGILFSISLAIGILAKLGGEDLGSMIAAAGAIDIVLYELANAFNELKFKSNKGEDIRNNVLAIGGILLAVAGSLALLSRFGGDWNKMIAAAGAIDIVLFELSDAFNELNFKKKLSDGDVKKNVLAIGGILLALSVSLAILSGLGGSPAKMIAGAAALGLVLPALSGAFNHMSFKNDLDMKSILKNVLAMGGVLLAIAVPLAILTRFGGSATQMLAGSFAIDKILFVMSWTLGKFEKTDIEWKDVWQNAVLMGLVLAEVTGSLIVLTQFAGNAAGVIEAATSISTVISVVTFAIKVLEYKGNLDWDEVKKTAALLGITLAEVVGALVVLTNFAGKQAGVIEAAAGIAVAINSVAIAMVILSKAKLNKSRVKTNAETIGIALAEVTVALIALTQFSGDKAGLISAAAAIGIAINSVALSMVVLSKAHFGKERTISNALAMGIALGAVTGALAVLTHFGTGNIGAMIAAAVSIGIAINATAASMVILSNTKFSAKSIVKNALAMSLALAAVTGALAVLTKLSGENIPGLIASAIAIGIAINATAASMVILSNTKFSAKSIVLNAAAMGLALIAVTAALAVLTKFGGENIQGMIASAVAIGICINAVAAAMLILSFAKFDAKTALANALAMGLALAAVTIALGVLTSQGYDFASMVASATAIGICINAAAIAMRIMADVDFDMENAIANSIMLGAALFASAGALAVLITFGGNDPVMMLASATALSGVVSAAAAAMKIMAEVEFDISKAIANSIMMGAALFASAGALAVLIAFGGSDPAMMLASATALSEVVIAVAAAMRIMADVDFPIESVLPNALMMGVALAATVAALAILDHFTEDPVKLLGVATAMSEILIALAAAMFIMGKSNMTWTTALVAVENLAVLLVGLEGVFALMGALNNATGLAEAAEAGIQSMVGVFQALGELIGSFVGGLMTGFTDQLPKVALSLSLFAVALQPFISLMSSGNMSAVLDGVTDLVGMMLLLTGAEFLDGITRAFAGEGSLELFGEQLSGFSRGFGAFVAAVGGMDDAGLAKLPVVCSALTQLAEAANEIPNTGGLAGLIMGNNDVDDFGQKLVPFIAGFRQFVSACADFPENGLAKVGPVATGLSQMAEAADKIPNSGGYLAKFIGDNDIDVFSAKLVPFVTDFKTFVRVCANFSDEGLEKVTVVANALSDVALAAKKIPNSGGKLGEWVGENDIDVFGEKLVPFVGGFKEFVNTCKDLPQEGLDRVEPVVTAITDIAKVADELPNSGGVLAFWVGDNDMDAFGEQLVGFATAFSSFANCLGGITDAGLANTEKVILFIDKLKDIDVATDTFDPLIKLTDTLKKLSDKLTGKDAPDLDKIASAAASLKDLKDVFVGLTNVDWGDDGGVKNFTDALHNLGDVSVDDFVEAFEGSGEKVKTAVTDMFTEAIDGMKDAASTVDMTDSVKHMISSLVVGMSDYYEQFKNTGYIYIQKMEEGVEEGGEEFVASVSNLASLASGEDITASFKDIGTTIITKIVSGITDGSQYATSSIGLTMLGLSTSLTNYNENFKMAGSSAGSAYVEGIGNAFLDFNAKIESSDFAPIQTLLDTVTSFSDKLTEEGTDIDALSSAAQSLRDLADVLLDLSSIDFGDGNVIDKFNESLSGISQDSVNKFIETFTTSSDSIRDAIVQMFNNAILGLQEEASTVDMSGAVSTLCARMAVAMSEYYEVFYNTGTILVDHIAEGIADSGATLAESISSVVNSSSDSTSADSFQLVGSNIAIAISKGISAGTDSIRNAAKKLTSIALTTLSGDYSFFESTGEVTGSKYGSGIGAAENTSKAASSAKSLASAALNGVGHQWDAFYQLGKNAADGFAMGIRVQARAAANAAAKMVRDAISAAKAAEDSHSPSKEFAKLGRYADEGYAVGVRRYADVATAATGGMIKDSLDILQSAIKQANDRMFNSDINEPTIRPVLDLSALQAGTYQMNQMLGNQDFGVSMSLANKAASSTRNQNSIGNLANATGNLNKSMNDLNAALSGNGTTINVTMTVSGADNPEDWANRFVRSMRREARMSG